MRFSPSVLRGDSLFARALRGSALTVLGYGGQQAMRLAANLVLTRLLFPEAFGLMALITVFLVGLMMFSDVGIGPSILQNPRGDDQDFLDTAWTIQAIRGVLLWITACALAWPAASFYNEPQLAQMLPVAALALVITGLMPTRVLTANRHLRLGQFTALELSAQAFGILATIVLAWHMRSVWALVAGHVLGTTLQVLIMHFAMPGPANRFRWQASARHDLIGYGKWVFLSTVCAFAESQGDRAILGKYLTLEQLGVYNIGFFLAGFPLALGMAVIGKMMIPLYRECPPAASAENFARLRRMRFLLTGGLMTLVLVLAFLGVVLVEFLYDPLYALAGPIVVLLACVHILHLVGLSYGQAALAAGDSRGFFLLTVVRAVLFLACFLVGVETAGLFGAIIGHGVAWLLIHPATIVLARRHGAWDPLHDALFIGLGLGLGVLALWLNRAALAPLVTMAAG